MRFGVLAGLLLVTSTSSAQSVHVYDGYLKGETYVTQSPATRSAYVMGVVDGLLSSGFYGASKEEVRKVHACTFEMSSEALRDVVDNYLLAHKDVWKDPMSVLVSNALVGACPVMRPGG
ncbi:Rap1a/Tai family immunity protein [Xanthomonas medicagonis]|uniref:Rap1a/Tai family immunity protein n=1 Tax=Xanthomonas medicagonis TaxID=3160841 RepID=UPI003B226DD2